MITAIVVAIAFMTVSNVSATEERQVRFPISIADVEARTNAKFTGADTNMDGLLSSEWRGPQGRTLGLLIWGVCKSTIR